MTQYIIRRLLFGLALIFLASIVSFTILRASPGRRGAADYDPRVSKEYIEQLDRLRGEDQPAVKQYITWMGGLFRGDLGLSDQYKQPVSTVIQSRIGVTLMVNLITLALTWAIAIPLGTYAAVKQYKVGDKAVTLVSFVGMSLPGFFLAFLMLWIFASGDDPNATLPPYRWLPAQGLKSLDYDKYSAVGKLWDVAKHLIIPVVVLTIGALASLQRVTRANMLETLRLQYVTTARAKGLSEEKVILKHALRNAINPLVTLLGFEFAALFGGAALLEIIVNLPGMGVLMLEALRAKDQWLVMGVFLIGSVMLVLGNLLGDILLAWADPRVSHG